jgi:Tol biopolymer transport system component
MLRGRSSTWTRCSVAILLAASGCTDSDDANEPALPLLLGDWVSPDDLARGDLELWVIDLAGSARQVTTNSTHDFNPSLSSDGQGLLYQSTPTPRDSVVGLNAEDWELWSSDADGRNALARFEHETGAAWAPGNERIANAGRPVGYDDYWIWVKTADMNLGRAVADMPGIASSPTWSPDGTALVFAHRPHKSEQSELWRVEVAAGAPLGGGSEEPQPLGSRAIAGEDPTWSPDGSRIAYINDGRLYTVDADGTGEHPVLDMADAQFDPAWSPDGQWIAFAMGDAPSQSDARAHVYIVRPDGSDLTQITDGVSYDRTPAWASATQLIVASNAGLRAI